jgi:hypothetical protein
MFLLLVDWICLRLIDRTCAFPVCVASEPFKVFLMRHRASAPILPELTAPYPPSLDIQLDFLHISVDLLISSFNIDV